MSWVRVYIHLVFSTKNREPFLSSSELRKNVFQHIKHIAKEKEIWLDCVSGYSDHLQSVRDYIHNQELHHSIKSFKEEVNEFMEKYGWKYIQE
ncbi:MAG: hypothetical protein EXR24_00935 [Ignavibacteria bacterium]|nr:hypothetical protein [Ignavibacteria bacterium]